jgi:hypothetical protein
VPDSQYSLRENPKFLQNCKPKNNTLKEIFGLILFFNICHCNSCLAFKIKNYDIALENFMHFIRENSKTCIKKQLSFVKEAPALTTRPHFTLNSEHLTKGST